MNRIGLALAGLVTISVVTPSWAAEGGYISGNDLKPMCAAPAGTQAAIYCLAYITGAVDAVRATQSVTHIPIVCEPVGVTPGQVLAMTNKYFSDHPETLHITAATLVAEAMTEAFPCPKPELR